MFPLLLELALWTSMGLDWSPHAGAAATSSLFEKDPSLVLEEKEWVGICMKLIQVSFRIHLSYIRSITNDYISNTTA